MTEEALDHSINLPQNQFFLIPINPKVSQLTSAITKKGTIVVITTEFLTLLHDEYKLSPD